MIITLQAKVGRVWVNAGRANVQYNDDDVIFVTQAGRPRKGYAAFLTNGLLIFSWGLKTTRASRSIRVHPTSIAKLERSAPLKDRGMDTKCPKCGSQLHFKSIGGMRVVRDDLYDAKCPKCNVRWDVAK